LFFQPKTEDVSATDGTAGVEASGGVGGVAKTSDDNVAVDDDQTSRLDGVEHKLFPGVNVIKLFTAVSYAFS
jgi:hypothetical protein